MVYHLAQARLITGVVQDTHYCECYFAYFFNKDLERWTDIANAFSSIVELKVRIRLAESHLVASHFVDLKIQIV